MTNPPEPTMGTPINQTSDSRLLTVNSIDDLYVPPASLYSFCFPTEAETRKNRGLTPLEQLYLCSARAQLGDWQH